MRLHRSVGKYNANALPASGVNGWTNGWEAKAPQPDPELDDDTPEQKLPEPKPDDMPEQRLPDLELGDDPPEQKPPWGNDPELDDDELDLDELRTIEVQFQLAADVLLWRSRSATN